MDLQKTMAQIARHEGTVPHAYQDSLGYWTIGVGHLIDKRLGGRLPEHIIAALLLHDVTEAEEMAKKLPWYKDLSEPRKGVIVNLYFNMGPKFDKFVNTQAAMARGDWEAAAQGLEQSLWARQVGRRAVELVKQWREDKWVS